MIEQIIIMVMSCGSIFLLSSKRLFRWGFVVGLMGQPFWIHTALTHEQWGILAVSLWYTIAHVRGIRNHFKKA